LEPGGTLTAIAHGTQAAYEWNTSEFSDPALTPPQEGAGMSLFMMSSSGSAQGFGGGNAVPFGPFPNERAPNQKPSPNAHARDFWSSYSSNRRGALLWQAYASAPPRQAPAAALSLMAGVFGRQLPPWSMDGLQRKGLIV
jgi:hypothetical protein